MSRLLHTVWDRALSSSFCFSVNQTLPNSCNEFYKRLIYGRGLENFVHISKNQRMAAMSTATSNGNIINHADNPGKKFKIGARSAEISHEVHSFSSDRLIWVDLEMTGLDFVRDRILEIAILITEPDLQIVAEGPNIIINESDEVLENMGEWCKQQHGKSGLAEAVRQSKVSLVQAEQMVLEFVRQHTPAGRCPLAGNTIGMDRSFIERHMPEFARHLHHRVIDVSTIKELCRRWFPEDFKVAPVKKENHRAMDDILESIAELKFYRSAIFKKPFVLL